MNALRRKVHIGARVSASNVHKLRGICEQGQNDGHAVQVCAQKLDPLQQCLIERGQLGEGTTYGSKGRFWTRQNR